MSKEILSTKEKLRRENLDVWAKKKGLSVKDYDLVQDYKTYNNWFYWIYGLALPIAIILIYEVR